jgi:hypothetical protein
MNAMVHCAISQRHWGGCATDYYAIHHFIDSTKVLCSDGRHRVLHTLWGINYVVIPRFGTTLTNSDGRQVDIKDLCERDHLLIDYQKRFIPTLADFVNAMVTPAIPDLAARIEAFHARYQFPPQISELMLSPLAITGTLNALLLTHNSWFVNHILPTVFPSQQPVLADFDLSPALFFNAMRFEPWMDNGLTYPPSAQSLQHLIQV